MNYEVKELNDRHIIELDGHEIAELSLVHAGDSAYIADGTWVDDAYRGQGLGVLLVDSVAQRARREGKKIVPLCPFVRAQFEKSDKYRDIAA